MCAITNDTCSFYLADYNYKWMHSNKFFILHACAVLSQITYSFARQTQSSPAGRLFTIDPKRGDVTLRAPLDYEGGAGGGAGGASHSLTVVATDQGPGGVPAYARLVVHVEDVNDNAPAIRVNALSADGYGEVRIHLVI